MSDDPFRWCVYCGADCYQSEPTHQASCPSATGLFPVDRRQLEPAGMGCSDCQQPFEVGDVYAHRQVQEDVYEIICVACKAQGLSA